MASNNYSQDVTFLKERAEVVELGSGGPGRVAVVPAYQGRVMTSTFAGPEGPSFGWINADFIRAGQKDPKFNNYGGEDRFWLGPEAGQFGLWFREGDSFDLDHWRTPVGIDAGTWKVVSCSDQAVAMETRFEVANYSGTRFDCGVHREVALLDDGQVADALGVELPDGVSLVAYETRNTLTNTGDRAWDCSGGLLSIWILGMYKPLPQGRIIVPFVAGSETKLGPRATTDYFGPIPPDRCAVADDHLLLTCDGNHRGKVGVSPARARNVLGSFDPDGRVLTLVQTNLPADAADRPYVNSMWAIQEKPFAGDAINAYNDGEDKPGAGQMGPFYELETSSPAAELEAGRSMTHIHRTYHLSGPVDALRAPARKTLDVDLAKI